MWRGKNFERPAYKKLFKALKSGDLIVIKSIDRLGRNYTEILEQWKAITKEIKADIAVLDMPLLDTRKQSTDLTGTLIANLVLQILSYVAQKERESIRQRQAEGIAAAKTKGVHFGRNRKALPPKFEEIRKEYIDGTISLSIGAKKLGMSKSTFYRRVRLKL